MSLACWSAVWTGASAAVAASLAAAACWGIGDFSGGMATRRASALQIVALAHGADVLALAAWIWFAHAPRPDSATLLWGLGSGLVNGFAITAFYVALASGKMGPAASLGGLITAVIPILVDARIEGAPSMRHVAGFVLAAVAIVLLTRQDDVSGGRSRRANLLACAAGIGFGIFLVMSREASRGALLWPLAASRAGSAGIAVTGLLLVRSPSSSLRWSPLSKRTFALAMVAGAADMIGNLLFMWSTRAGRLDVAAVCASLYPAITVLLAIFFLRERLSRVQVFGIVLALAAVGLISAY